MIIFQQRQFLFIGRNTTHNLIVWYIIRISKILRDNSEFDE